MCLYLQSGLIIREGYIFVSMIGVYNQGRYVFISVIRVYNQRRVFMSMIKLDTYCLMFTVLKI